MIERLNINRTIISGALSASVLVAGLAMAEDVERGQVIYEQTCVACHSADGRGALPGVPDFTSKNGPMAKDDALLLRHVTDGFQTPGSIMAMPPKGGNSDLTEEDIKNVIQYIRDKYGA